MRAPTRAEHRGRRGAALGRGCFAFLRRRQSGVSDVSFDIRKGEIRAIIGPNGAGKTSMLNIINGFYQPQHGRITFKGETRVKDAAQRSGARRHGAHVPERSAVQGDDRAGQPHGGADAANEARLPLAAAAVSVRRCARRRSTGTGSRRSSTSGLRRIRKVEVGRLPYGLQKRVELGRALAMEPDLLLLDEPMAGMNLEEKEDMSRFIIDVNTITTAPPLR